MFQLPSLWLRPSRLHDLQKVPLMNLPPVSTPLSGGRTVPSACPLGAGARPEERALCAALPSWFPLPLFRVISQYLGGGRRDVRVETIAYFPSFFVAFARAYLCFIRPSSPPHPRSQTWRLSSRSSTWTLRLARASEFRDSNDGNVRKNLGLKPPPYIKELLLSAGGNRGPRGTLSYSRTRSKTQTKSQRRRHSSRRCVVSVLIRAYYLCVYDLV